MCVLGILRTRVCEGEFWRDVTEVIGGVVIVSDAWDSSNKCGSEAIFFEVINQVIVSEAWDLSNGSEAIVLGY